MTPTIVDEAVGGSTRRLIDDEPMGAGGGDPSQRLPDDIASKSPPPPDDAPVAPPREPIRMRNVIGGGDERQRVGNTQDYPWRAICHLIITNHDGSLSEGTGWFIGPRTVMTAGHNVFSHAAGGDAQSICVIPGRNGRNNAPFHFQFATHWETHPSYPTSSPTDLRFDFGAVFLPDASMGTKTGRFLFDSFSNQQLDAMVANIAGYPNEHQQPIHPGIFGSQWNGVDKIEALTQFAIGYRIDTTAGQSGSPVFVMNTAGHAVGLAVHVHGAPFENQARRISSSVKQQMLRWMNLQIS